MASKQAHQRTLRWIAAIAVTVIVNVLLFATWSGSCTDFANASTANLCTSGPVLGAPATWAIAALSAIAIAYFASRIVKALRPTQ